MRGGWDSIATPQSITLPSLWKGLGKPKKEEGVHYVTSEPDLWGRLYKESLKSGLSVKEYEKQSWYIWHMLSGASLAPLYGEPELYGLTSDDIHKTEHSLFAHVDALTWGKLRKGDIASGLGETIITNIGEGEPSAFKALHAARTRTALYIGTNLQPVFKELQLENPDEVSQLSRALTQENKGKFDLKHYNPLMHAFLEGTMTTGQAVNFVVQSGVQGESVTLKNIKDVLTSPIPAIVGKLVTTGYIGPNQLAGLSVKNTLEYIDMKPVLQSAFKESLVAYRNSERQRQAEIEGDELTFMQDIANQAVNRHEGCPANRLIKLSSRMILDALET